MSGAVSVAVVVLDQAVDIVVAVETVPLVELILVVVAADSLVLEIYLQSVQAMYH